MHSTFRIIDNPQFLTASKQRIKKHPEQCSCIYAIKQTLAKNTGTLPRETELPEAEIWQTWLSCWSIKPGSAFSCDHCTKAQRQTSFRATALHDAVHWGKHSSQSLCQSSYFLKHEIRLLHSSIPTYSYYSLSYNYWKISSCSCRFCDCPYLAKFGGATFILGALIYIPERQNTYSRRFFLHRDMRNIHEIGKWMI